MNSFFDVFKWDRFIAPSAMELLFWLVSAIAVLFGVWGLSSGIAMVETAPVPGLVLIAVSIIGTLAGIVAARIACEAVVILFRVNENLMDIAERGFTAMPTQIVESAAVRLEHRAPEPREEPPPARRQAERSATIIEDLPPIFDAEAEDEDDAADPFAPDQGRVEPRAWDVKPVQPKPAQPKTAQPQPAQSQPAQSKPASAEVVAPEPQPRMRDVTPPAARERTPSVETRAKADRTAEARPSDRREREPQPSIADLHPEPRPAETRPDRPAPPIVVPEPVEQPAADKREAARRRAASDEAAIEQALKRLSQPAAANAAAEQSPSRERRMPAARVEDADFISPAASEPPRREARRPGTGKVDVRKGEAGRPERAKSETARSGTTKPETAHSEAVRPEAPKSGAPKSEAGSRDEPRAGAQKPAGQRRRPVAEEEATPLPAFLAVRAEPEVPIDLPPMLARQEAQRQDAARQDGTSREPRSEAPERRAAAPRTVREKTAPAVVRESGAERPAEPRRDHPPQAQKPKGGQAPLKRRRPRRERDEA